MAATIRAWYQYADGDRVCAEVTIDTSYPDAVSEGVKTCSDMLREAMVCGLVVQAEDDDEG